MAYANVECLGKKIQVLTGISNTITLSQPLRCMCAANNDTMVEEIIVSTSLHARPASSTAVAETMLFAQTDQILWRLPVDRSHKQNYIHAYVHEMSSNTVSDIVNAIIQKHQEICVEIARLY